MIQVGDLRLESRRNDHTDPGEAPSVEVPCHPVFRKEYARSRGDGQ